MDSDIVRTLVMAFIYLIYLVTIILLPKVGKMGVTLVVSMMSLIAGTYGYIAHMLVDVGYTEYLLTIFLTVVIYGMSYNLATNYDEESNQELRTYGVLYVVLTPFAMFVINTLVLNKSL